jgi:hypothetical protein
MSTLKLDTAVVGSGVSGGDNDDIFIVGEAYSIEQGWVGGALGTAETMLIVTGLYRQRA